MIGVTPSFLSALASCGWSNNHLTEPLSGSPRYPYVASTRTPGWTGQWAIGNSGDSISDSTYNALRSATAVTSPDYLSGCYVTAAGTTYQLTENAGAALPSDPPPPPPPPR
jgi:hypothetical protein